MENFKSELNFVKKLLADFTVEPLSTRVAIITFAGRNNVHRNVDQISQNEPNHQKCQLLGKQLGNITYAGGGTFTLGALLAAFASIFFSFCDTTDLISNFLFQKF